MPSAHRSSPVHRKAPVLHPQSLHHTLPCSRHNPTVPVPALPVHPLIPVLSAPAYSAHLPADSYHLPMHSLRYRSYSVHSPAATPQMPAATSAEPAAPTASVTPALLLHFPVQPQCSVSADQASAAVPQAAVRSSAVKPSGWSARSLPVHSVHSLSPVDLPPAAPAPPMQNPTGFCHLSTPVSHLQSSDKPLPASHHHLPSDPRTSYVHRKAPAVHHPLVSHIGCFLSACTMSTRNPYAL
ncbi:unknown [Clostridium sp. CAG:632]|nr:unknown [Clostridium sp. CAG:632]